MTEINDSLVSGIFSTPAMDRVFSDSEQVQQMLRFEAALTSALEECGIASSGSSSALNALLQTPFLTAERAAQIRAAAASAGNIAIPFLKLLTQAVTEIDPQAAAMLHFGATSQDVLDTALVLQMQLGLRILFADLDATIAACSALAQQHASTVMPGRTWLQQGPPVTLGLKLAGYAAALNRSRHRLVAAQERAVVLQFGGAVGTLASLHEHGPGVASALARNLQLREPAMPWHAHRDNLAEVAASLGILVGTLGKVARDLSLSMQTEIGELAEPAAEGRGGSSTMPHKRNPIACAAILATAVRVPHLVATMLSAMVQEHERGLGGWQAEWETLPEIFRLSASALNHTRQTLEHLQVAPDAMRKNLDISRGLIFAEAVSAALTPHLGRSEAHRLVEHASAAATAQNVTLEHVLADDAQVNKFLTASELHDLFDPLRYLGSCKIFIDRALTSLDRGES